MVYGAECIFKVYIGEIYVFFCLNLASSSVVMVA